MLRCAVLCCILCCNWSDRCRSFQSYDAAESYLRQSYRALCFGSRLVAAVGMKEKQKGLFLRAVSSSAEHGEPFLFLSHSNDCKHLHVALASYLTSNPSLAGLT